MIKDIPPDYTHIANINNDVPARFTSAPESAEHNLMEQVEQNGNTLTPEMLEQYQLLNNTMEDLGAGIGEIANCNRRKGEIEEQINASKGPEFSDNCEPPKQGDDLNKGE
jgi:hypothetical protein